MSVIEQLLLDDEERQPPARGVGRVISKEVNSG